MSTASVRPRRNDIWARAGHGRPSVHTYVRMCGLTGLTAAAQLMPMSVHASTYVRTCPVYMRSVEYSDAACLRRAFDIISVRATVRACVRACVSGFQYQ